jgi:hypothetical protein
MPEPEITGEVVKFQGWLRDVMHPTDAENVRALVMVEINEIKRSISLAHEDAVRIPTEVQKQVENLRGLLMAIINGNDAVYLEKFGSIGTQFIERDKRTEKMEIATATAVSAALQAAKELSAEQGKAFAQSIAKSEAATSKQLEQLTVMQQAGNKTSDDKTNDLKERVTLLEGQRKGGSDFLAIAIAIVAVAASIVIPFVLHK